MDNDGGRSNSGNNLEKFVSTPAPRAVFRFPASLFLRLSERTRLCFALFFRRNGVAHHDANEKSRFENYSLADGDISDFNHWTFAHLSRRSLSERRDCRLCGRLNLAGDSHFRRLVVATKKRLNPEKLPKLPSAASMFCFLF